MDRSKRFGCAAVVVVAAVYACPVLLAQNPVGSDTVRHFRVDTLRINGRIDNLVGTASSASQGLVGAAEIRARPIAREGELLETVPGLIVTQHSGDGKANQYFVRGFNLDHGTDFQTRLEGMPVNLPTHGHGQGYTDLNFLIPELVDYLDYRLGVHHAEIGDFGSAGGAEIHLVSRLDQSFVALAGGQNGLARASAGASWRVAGGDFLAGGEVKAYDGPWDRPETLRKLSGLARYTWSRGPSRLSLLAMGYQNRWSANDQIPLRAVEEGMIGRLGQIDTTGGGHSARYSLSGSWKHAGRNTADEVQVFAIRSELDLFSNFTFFLNDPVHGDQFHQQDRRWVLGGNAAHTRELRALGVEHTVKLGIQTRADLIDGLRLDHTQARQVLGTVRSDRVRELGTGIFAESVSRWRPWLRSVVGVRADGFSFHVASDRAENSGSRRAAIVSPKASLVITPSPDLEVYVSGGFGFHSNDARGTTITVDPASGEAAERVTPLVRSRGAELGIRATPARNLRSTLSLWTLGLESELLFVGDAGATEPSGASERRGVTWANFYRPHPWLSLDADVSLARARLTGAPAAENRIPGALDNVVAAGVAWTPAAGAFGSVRLRHFGSYPLTEDNGVRADPSMIVNADAGYRLRSGIEVRATLLNLFNGKSDDIQYYYPSRLAGETGGVDDVHFHAFEPRQLRVSLRLVIP